MSKTISSKDGLRFDWYPILQADFIDDLAAEVIATIETARTSTRGVSKASAEKRTQQHLIIAKHLLSALYCAYSTITSKKTLIRVSVIKKTEGYSPNKIQYPTRIHYTFRNFIDVYDALEQLKWISIVKGEVGKGYTRIHSKNRLKATFKTVGLGWFPQTLKASEDLIVLRDKIEVKRTKPSYPKARKKYKKITMATPDTPEVATMADDLLNINQFLTSHCFALNVSDEQLYEIAKVLAGYKKDADNDKDRDTNIDFSRIQLRRIFSQNSLSKGGRFYNGWWQSIPSIYRHHITIDGYKTSEVDYSSVSVRIVYAQAGIDVDPHRDLYDIGLDDWKGRDDPRRKIIKQYMNALMNHHKGDYKLKAPQRKALGLTNRELRSLVLKHHAPIADQLTSNIGGDLQFLDSRIAELVINTLREDDIVVLPIHDSFIVRRGYRSWLETVMKAASKAIIDASVPVRDDGARLIKHFGMDKEQYKKELENHNDDPSSGIVNPNDLDLDSIFKKTLMKDYQSHWDVWKAKDN